MELHASQNMSKKSKAKSSYDKGKSKFTSLQETLSAIDEEYESVHNVTALLLESGAKDIPTDEEDNFGNNEFWRFITTKPVNQRTKTR